MCLRGGSVAVLARWRILAQLAEITTLVARYNVMESIYHQWPGMTLDKNYEDSLINLSIAVLQYLDLLYTFESETTKADFAVTSQDFVYSIRRADEACRGFSITFVQDILQRALNVVEEVDSDLDETIMVSRGVKKISKDMSGSGNDQDCTEADAQKAKELPIVKRKRARID